MIELTMKDLQGDMRQSSKGNQLKWKREDSWYKADYTGYEGLSEYMVSKLLAKSTLKKELLIDYDTEEILYKNQKWTGCKSQNFLPEGWQLITLEHLFQKYYGESLNKSIYAIPDLRERIRFVVENTERITGLYGFGEYINLLLTIDAFFLNEDRHTHNIAVLLDDENKYHFCPVFDNGAALLSDVTLDYPLEGDLDFLMNEVESKTFCRNFDEQLEEVELLYPKQIRFSFTERDIEGLLNQEMHYPEEIKKRVAQIIFWQKRKYSYLFK